MNEDEKLRANEIISKIHKNEANNDTARRDQNNKEKSCNYIESKLKESPIVLDHSIFNEIVNAIYESLREERYNDSMILSKVADRSIINYITDGLYNIRFKQEFDQIYRYIKNYTLEIFNEIRKEETDGRLELLEYFSKGRNKNLDYISYKVALQVKDENLDLNSIYESGKLYEMIYSEIVDDIAKKNSVSNEIQTEVRVERKKEKKPIPLDTIKKAMIIASIIVGIVAVSNTKSNDNHDSTPKKPTETTEYVVDHFDNEMAERLFSAHDSMKGR